MSAFAHETRSRTEKYAGPIFTVYTDEVTMSGGGTADRDVVINKNAVGVVALDDVGRVVLIRQYRHPVGKQLWELPAGLRDVEGEDLAVTAGRELAEEADITARRFDLLVDLHTSPGFSAETIRIFLARDLSPVPEDERHDRKDEEADIEICWVDLDEAVAMVLRGEITNAAAVGGLLCAARARDDGWATLRPADTPPL
ncbi:ADP-ribose pyrophosphatase [Actinoplanes sp. NBRC 14428]|uniref:ADP-ribose pyrophosphatase n=1 Tax=Pseudosporangium ferrugineum TaxID=439699 RepID=A0A2T0REI4_9ACTN|nr:NUDIX hydrolase [Pseudosporangium ferrugineum]PRY19567.1 ADP-ribose pyrophosphatase [Pseudosporangium ferrugineum]BCJ55842.1 ADP-ribose pyrophosphatase [Actinoplanes sp. NBRC 14428]